MLGKADSGCSLSILIGQHKDGLGPRSLPYREIKSPCSLCWLMTDLLWEYLECSFVSAESLCVIWHLANHTAMSALCREVQGCFHCGRRWLHIKCPVLTTWSASPRPPALSYRTWGTNAYYQSCCSCSVSSLGKKNALPSSAGLRSVFLGDSKIKMQWADVFRFLSGIGHRCMASCLTVIVHHG